MPTTVQSSNRLTNKIFNAALFFEATRRNSFTNLQTGRAPSLGTEAKKARGQSEPGAPIVRVRDLEKTAGDEVTVDIFHQLRQKPVMGDAVIAGKGAQLSYASFSLKIDQGRTLVDAGGKMSQKRTSHDLQQVAKSLLSPYYNRLDDQIAMVHLAGARGSHNDSDWILPTAADPDFDDIMVNPVTPPTYDRHFYGGDATSLATLDTADKFDLPSLDKLRLVLDEMPYPLQPIRFEGDPMSEDNPFHVLWVSPRQWYDFYSSASGTAWNTLLSNAISRSKEFNHPIFRGECAMRSGILVRKMSRPIQFAASEVVTVCTNSVDASTTTATAAVKTNRALLMGAQALATCYGTTGGDADSGEEGGHFSMNVEKTDHKNRKETSISWMNGKAKIRFKGTDGRINDYGVAVVDTAVS